VSERTQTRPQLWSAIVMAGVCDGVIDGHIASPITGISIDTRTIEPGDLFVALRDQRDGHDFVTQAFKAGAAAALVSNSYARRDGDGALIRVADPLRALEDAGRVARFRTDAKIVAVTGSVGKTGTKEMLRLCLERAGATHASEKSYNNHWGVPLTLARMPAATRYGVFEIGMNHAGEIAPLTRMVAPDVAVITTVEAVHLAHFASVSDIAEAKAEILLGVPAGGIAILNRDNPHFDLLAMRADERSLRVVAFGSRADCDVRLDSFAASDSGSEVMLSLHGKPVSYHIGAPGRHYVMNSLAVVATLDALGVDLALCLAALDGLMAPAGRGARSEIDVAGGKLLLIDESYNANPASMAAALANLGAVPRDRWRRRIAILGDMRELGAEADGRHKALAPLVEAAGCDAVFACGPHMRMLYEGLPQGVRGAYAATSAELVAAVTSAVVAGDAVMIKGSLGTNMSPLVAAVRALSKREA